MPHRKPLVSVLFPIYNAENYILRSVTSILNQSESNFELLIIDDGCTDASVAILQSIPDPRIRIIKNEHNRGLSDTLNYGIALAQGEFIARMDHDDLAHPDRLRKQLKFFQDHPEIDLLGTAFRIFGATLPRVIRNPESHAEIKAALLFDSAFAHPTTMFRKASFQKFNLHYHSEFNRAEDFELWTRAIFHLNTANLSMPLLDYRVHANQASTAASSKQRELAKKIRTLYLQRLTVDLTEADREIHEKIAYWDFSFLESGTDDFHHWLKKFPKELSGLHAHLTYRATIAYYSSSKKVKASIQALGLFNPNQVKLNEKTFLILRRIYRKIKT